MVRKTKIMKVDVNFHNLFMEKSKETGLSLVDLTRIEAMQFRQGAKDFEFSFKEKGKKKKKMTMLFDEI